MENHCADLGVIFKDDAEAVSFVARLLEISEFRLFEIAYENWFGSEATKKAMDDIFGSYLKSEFVPFWLRDMMRKVMCEHEKVNPTPGKLGMNQLCLSRFFKGFGWIVVGLLSVLVFAIV